MSEQSEKVSAERRALDDYQEKHSTCDIQSHPWHAVFGAGFDAGHLAARSDRAALEAEVHLYRDVLAQIVGAFASGIYCANCGDGVEMCRCIIDLARTALAAPAERRGGGVMDAHERLRQHVDETLRSLEPSATDLANHDCSTHPKITHERWLQCQHEIRAILAGTPDPEWEAHKRQRERDHEEMRKRLEEFYS